MDQIDNSVKDSPEYKRLASRIKTMNLLAWCFVVFGGIVMATGAGLLLFGGHDELTRIGDFSGGIVASIWSLAGIMFVYTAFLGQQQQMMLQEEELKLSREELKATRVELLGQKEALEEQVKTAESQRFENTFFALLEGLLSNINSLRLVEYSDEPPKTGFGVYSYLILTFKGKYKASERTAQVNDGGKEVTYQYKESTLGGVRRTLTFSLLSVQKIINESFIYTRRAYDSFENSGDPSAIAKETLVLIGFVNKQKNLSDEEKEFYQEVIYSKLTKDFLTYLIYYVFRYKEMIYLQDIITNMGSALEISVSNLLIEYHHLQLFSFLVRKELEEE